MLEMQELNPKRKLLLADDSVTIQKVVNLTFADEGIEVVSVGDGDSAMERLLEDLPDIVLADVNMPGLTGYEICARIKARAAGDQIPVVLLVGSFEPFDEDEAERVGADGYLTKPFQSISQLVDKVAELLGTKTPDTPSVADLSPIGVEHQSFADPARNTGEFEPFGVADEESERDREPGVVSESVSKFETPLENPFADFQDEDEFEMSEAFGDDESAPAADAFPQDQQIEEVGGDFLKTQPLTQSDLQEMLVDGETTLEIETEAETQPAAEETFVDAEFYPLEDESRASDEGFGDANNEETPVNDELGLGEQEGIGFANTGFESETISDHNDDTQSFPMPEGASVLNLDEINLLELPPVDTNSAEDFDYQDGEIDYESNHEEAVVENGLETEEPPVYNSIPESDEFDEGADIVVETIKGSDESEPRHPITYSAELKKNVDQALSKEMVEAITQRVIETLSERAIKEIAWEVVPDLADLIIKKMAEEKMKE